MVFFAQIHLFFRSKKGFGFGGVPLSPPLRTTFLAKKELRIWGVPSLPPPSPLQTKSAKQYLMSSLIGPPVYAKMVLIWEFGLKVEQSTEKYVGLPAGYQKYYRDPISPKYRQNAIHEIQKSGKIPIKIRIHKNVNFNNTAGAVKKTYLYNKRVKTAVYCTILFA